MKKQKSLLLKLSTYLAFVVFMISLLVFPAIGSDVKELHFFIPGETDSGWDDTTRGVGKALLDSGLLEQASFEKISGSGGKALNHLTTTAEGREKQYWLIQHPSLFVH